MAWDRTDVKWSTLRWERRNAVAVPDIVGENEDDADVLILAAGFSLGVNTQTPSTTVYIDDVISQDPVAGTMAVIGSEVTYHVSMGTVVPTTIGFTQAQAETRITDNGLTVGAVTEESDEVQPLGDVVSSDPVAGTPLEIAVGVDLVVSLGSIPLVTNPWSLDQAAVEFTGNNSFNITVTGLEDGNAMVLYGTAAASPFYVIPVDVADGSLIGSPVQIASTGGDYLRICTLTNGNVVIAFTDENASYAVTYGIFSPAGATVKALSVFDTGLSGNSKLKICRLSTGGFGMVHVVNGYPGSLQIIIFDEDGAEVTPRPAVQTMSIYASPVSLIENTLGGFIMPYCDWDEFLYYQKISAAGVVTFQSEKIGGASYEDQYYPFGVCLSDGSLFMTWYDDYDEGDQVYAIWNASNTLTKAITVSSYREECKGLAATNTDQILWMTRDVPGYGFDLYDPDGTFVERISTVDYSGDYGTGGGWEWCVPLTGGQVASVSSGLNAGTPHGMVAIMSGTEVV